MTTTRTRTGKIWLGVGAAALVSTGGAAALVSTGGAAASDAATGSSPATPGVSRPSPSGVTIKLAQAAPAHDHGTGQPAEPAGGEGGSETGGAGLPANIRFLRDIGLIRGHLLVGDELVQQARWADGLPHFLHPIEEIYDAIRTPLKTKHIADFDAALKALAQTVKAKKPEAYQQALARVDTRLAGIEAAERATAGAAWPTTTVATVLALAQSAAGEYDGAIENGNITKPIEYQDSRGFVFYGAKLLAAVSSDLKAIDAGALDQAAVAYSYIKTAWPGPLPPGKPVLDQTQLLAAVSRFELAAGPFLNR